MQPWNTYTPTKSELDDILKAKFKNKKTKQKQITER